MTAEVYVSLNGNDYYRLDLMKSETILMKYIYKDTKDLSKIYSPYSQPFVLQGSLNNQKILGFLGETKIVKTKTNNVFDCKIYNNGLLAKKGLLKVTEARYENGKIKSYTANFTTDLLSLKDRMGEDKVSDLRGMPTLITWDNVSAKDYMQQGENTYNDNIDVFNFIVPFISNNRVWQVADINDTTKLDNIAYNLNADKNGDNFIKISELSPAIQLRAIIDLIKRKYDLDIVMPLEQETFYNESYVYCNKLEGSFNNSVYYDVINPFVFSINYTPTALVNQPYLITANNFTNEFTVTYYPAYDYANLNTGVFINIGFFTLQNTKSNENIDVTMIMERLNGTIYKEVSQNLVSGQNVNLTIDLQRSDFTANEFKFKLKITSNVPITWANSTVEMYYYRAVPLGPRPFYLHRSTNNNSSTMGMSKIDLFKSLPDLKVVDFLSSFFKTFNISIFETSPDDGRLYWLTPKDIQAENKEYSKTEVDYTDYVISDKLNKQIANDYNYYNFKHKTSKYYSNASYLRNNGVEYGQLTYPTIKPTKDLSEFKVETNFSIIQSSPVIGLNVNTLYGFTNENPSAQQNNALRYKPNTEDFTLFFYNGQIAPKTPYLGYLNIYPNGTKVIEQLNAVTIVSSIHEQSGFNLGFGLIETATNESLYENYYKGQTERLLEPNTLQHTYTLELPPSELVLNYANTNQGESNIPSGFRLQNDIVIQETRYSVIDATIDQTTGKTTLNLLNYV